MTTSRTDAALGGAAAAGAAATWQAGLDGAIRAANDAMREAAHQAGPRTVHGNLAEAWHASTFNIEAYKRGLHHLYEASAPHSNVRASPDVVVKRLGETIYEAQAKYYRNAGETAKQLWNPAYDNVDAKLVPQDQLQGVVEKSSQKILTEAQSRPHVAKAAQHSVDHATDRVSVDGIESRPLTHEQSKEAASAARGGEDVIHGSDVLSLSEIGKKAALGGAVAAGIGFAVGAAPELLLAVKKWREGASISDDEFQELLRSAGESGLRSGAWAGLQGTIATALVHLAGTGQLGSVLQQAGPGPIGAIAVVIVQSLRDAAAWHRGEIDGAEFSRRCLETSVVSAAGVGGAAVGQMLIPIPVLGALIGSTVGAIVARLGLTAAAWTIDKLHTHLSAVLDHAAEVLFGWDLLQTARKQSAELDALLARAGQVAHAAEAAEIVAFKDLFLDPIDVERLESETAGMRSRLEAFRATLGSSPSRSR